DVPRLESLQHLTLSSLGGTDAARESSRRARRQARESARAPAPACHARRARLAARTTGAAAARHSYGSPRSGSSLGSGWRIGSGIGAPRSARVDQRRTYGSGSSPSAVPPTATTSV